MVLKHIARFQYSTEKSKKKSMTVEIEDLFIVLEIKRFLQCDMFFDGLRKFFERKKNVIM